MVTTGTADTRPLIAHVIFRLDIGGLENGLVNLINGLPSHRFRHAIVCIDEHTDFANRIEADGVEIVAIRKQPGTDVSALWRLYRAFRRLRPDIVHTRNLAALDALLPARLAGVRWRIHGEHGWDVNDLGGHNRKLRLLRRLHSPLVSRYVALSEDLQDYLVRKVGVRADRVVRISNGVDVRRFRPGADPARRTVLPPDIGGPDRLVIGTVGRLQSVKDPLNLVDAFALLLRDHPEIVPHARLVIIGNGPLRPAVRQRLGERNVEQAAWMPGEREDIPEILRAMDVFVQPSLAEGISNTVLEAMASGLPVVATDVGGNPELVDDRVTGLLVPSADAAAMAAALAIYAQDPERRKNHGEAARERAERHFSISAMIRGYQRVYDEILERHRPAEPAA